MKIKMRLPLIFLLLTFLSSGVSSTLIAQEKYMHFMGSSEKGQAISLDLTIIDQKVSGFLHTALNSPIAIKGALMNEDSLILYQLMPEKPLIAASLNAEGEMKGDWADESNGHPIELSESYPSGTHRFQALAVSSIQPLVDAPDSPFAVFESSVIIPDETMDKGISDKFQSLLHSTLFRAKTAVDPKTMLQNEQSAYFDQYRSKNIDINSKENYPLLNWEKRKLMTVVFNAADLASLQFQDYTYTGGGAALEISRYLVFDVGSGRQIKLPDLVQTENMVKLSQKIREAICRNLNLDTSANLKNNGFFSNEVFVSENFYLTGYGIGFHYNTYELAGQETGPVSVFLSFDSVEDLLGESNIYQRVASK
jgi:hypothetical protein